jgi:orotidine-5'-phosphate decarboxylase
METFAEALLGQVERKQNPSVVGLDTEFAKLPDCLKSGIVESPQSASAAMLEFNKAIIDSVRDIVPAVKLQSAFYEMHGAPGVKAFWETAGYAKSRGLVVIGDVKRNDTGNTCRAYSKAYLSRDSPFGAITVNPYLGSDGVEPFLEDVRENGKGIFVLVKTSNPSSGEIQDLVADGRKVYERVADLVGRWGEESTASNGYSSVGAVVGATYPEEAAALRKLMPRIIFLVPGYGAQGGSARDVLPCFNRDGFGAIVHSARGIIFASRGDDFGEAAGQAALKMKSDITAAMKSKGICPW